MAALIIAMLIGLGSNHKGMVFPVKTTTVQCSPLCQSREAQRVMRNVVTKMVQKQRPSDMQF